MCILIILVLFFPALLASLAASAIKIAALGLVAIAIPVIVGSSVVITRAYFEPRRVQRLGPEGRLTMEIEETGRRNPIAVFLVAFLLVSTVTAGITWAVLVALEAMADYLEK